MPAVLFNLEALRFNARRSMAWSRKTGLSVLPVLKGLASHPLAVAALRAEGFSRFAFAETMELFACGRAAHAVLDRREDRVLMQICPLSGVRRVVADFGRSFHSQIATLQAADRAAGEQGLPHEVLIMVDVGEGREGVYREDFQALLEAMRPLRSLRCVGAGVTLGCMGQRLPDAAFEEELDALAGLMRHRGMAAPEISVGGSVFCAWIEARDAVGKTPITEIRLGANFMLGEDTYRKCDLPGGPYRRDVALLAAEVLEVARRRFDLAPPALEDTDGYPLLLPPPPGIRRCALLDAGRAHAKLEDLHCCLPGAVVIGVTSNYMILDVTECASPPRVGDRVLFRMGYWSMVRLFRSPAVEVVPVENASPELNWESVKK
jgi:predicted amino acid racemase